jgi:phenylpyruvate tautomerase PptA (4-oxalocrotonate tautomerase family)
MVCSQVFGLERKRGIRMPDVLIEVRGGWIGNRKKQLLLAVHDALIETIKTDPEDKVVRLVEYSADDFVIPTPAGERFTRIEITMFVGRSIEAKRMLYNAMVRRLLPFGIPAEDIKIVLIEVPRENVGIRGGQAASDIELSYVVNV